MEEAKTKGDLHGVETGLLLCEPFILLQVPGELASSYESHDEEDSHVSLKDVSHPDEEWVVRLRENVLLKNRRLNELLLQQLVFAQGLHRVHVARIGVLD